MPPPAPTIATVPSVAAAANAIFMVVSSPTKSNTAVAPSPPVSSRTCVAVSSSDDERLVCTELARQLESLRHEIDRDHLGPGEAAEELHRVRPESARADHDRGRTRHQLRQRALHRVVRGRAGVGERTDPPGVERGERHQLPAWDHQEVGEAPVLPVAAPAGAAWAVVVVTPQAVEAATTGVDAGDRHGLADLEVVHVGAELLDPTGALVTERERELPGDDAGR